jgi:Viral BACON domain
MQHCAFCGWELPSDARFCGHCGQIANNTIGESLTRNMLSSNAPTAISDPSHPRLTSGVDQEQIASTLWYDWPQEKRNRSVTPIHNDEEDEQERRRAAVLGVPLLGAFAAEGQVPGTTVPAVQGTPQLGGFPAVQGTPSIPGGQGIAGGAMGGGHGISGGAAPSTPWPSTLAGANGPHTPAPVSSPPLPSHHLHSSPTHPQHSPPHHAQSAHPSPPRPRGRLTNWLVIAFTAFVIIASIISGLIFLLPPSLSLSGSHDVASGETLHLHGGGFFPGSSVTLTLDGHPLLAAVPVGAGVGTLVASYPGDRDPAWGAGNASPFSAAVLQTLAAQQSGPSSPGSIKASLAGTFDLALVVDPGWSLGSHTIRATESSNSRSAELTFDIVARSAKLTVTPAHLDFNQVNKGSKVSMEVTISNTGQQPLIWSADTGAAYWLTLDSGTGTLQPGASQTIQVTADTAHLPVGVSTATIAINSNSGSAQVPVQLEVIKPAPVPAPKLDVKPASLDFGQLPAGSQAKQMVTISNLGTQDLNWTADQGNVSWLNLDTASGTIQAGGNPQVINVTADTTNLAAGTYSAALHINSNAGKQTIKVSLVVTSPLPPSTLPAQLQVNPSSLSYSFTDVAASDSRTVTIANTGQSPLNWTAALTSTSSNDVTIALSTTSGSLAGGAHTTLKVTVNTPGIPRTETITSNLVINATDPASGNPVANSPQTVSITITITAPPSPPQGRASLGTCSYAARTGWSCPLTLSAGANNQVDWSWSATSSGINGISINPSTGSLPAGRSTTATVLIPDTVCPARATITVSGLPKDITLPWSCSAPAWSIDQKNLVSCSVSNPCVVTLTEDANAQGQLSWTATGSTSTSPGTAPVQFTFNPANSVLSPGQSVKVTITQTNAKVPCSQTATLTFSGGLSDITVTWQSPSCIQVG